MGKKRKKEEEEETATSANNEWEIYIYFTFSSSYIIEERRPLKMVNVSIHVQFLEQTNRMNSFPLWTCAQYHTTLLPKQRFFHFSKIGWMGLKHTRPEIKHKSKGQVLCNKTLTTLIMSLWTNLTAASSCSIALHFSQSMIGRSTTLPWCHASLLLMSDNSCSLTLPGSVQDIMELETCMNSHTERWGLFSIPPFSHPPASTSTT